MTDQSTLLPEGTYTATVKSFGDISEGRKAFFLRIYLDIQGHERIKHIAGWPEGLMLLKRAEEVYVGQTWQVRINHRTIEERVFEGHTIIFPRLSDD